VYGPAGADVNGIIIGGLNGSVPAVGNAVCAGVTDVMDCVSTVENCEIEADDVGRTASPEIHAAADADALTVINSVMVLGAAVIVNGGAVMMKGFAVTVTVYAETVSTNVVVT
jgi:hypothetical protein